MPDSVERAERTAALLAAIVESSNDVIISKDLGGIITSWNRSAERTFGYSADEAIGRSILLIIPLDRHDEEREIISRVRHGERLSHFQTIRRRKDGSFLDFSVTISPILSTSGQVIGASKVGRDVTTEKQAEQSLRDSEARYRRLAEQVSDGIFRATPGGQYLDANAAGLEMFGHTLDELCALRVPDLLDPSEHPRLAAQFDALASGEVVQNEWLFRRKDGSTFMGELSGRVLPNGELLSVLRDITDRLRAENERRTTAALLNAILDGTPDLIWTKDLEGRFTLTNRAAANFYGDASARAPQLADNDQRVLSAAIPHTVEEELRTAAGEPVILHTFRAPLYSATGDLNGLMGISRDITSQKTNERALRENEERFRAMAELGPHFVWIVNQSGELEYVNQRLRQESGRAFEVRGPVSQLEAILPPDDLVAFQRHFNQASAAGNAFELEARIALAAAPARWFMIRGVPFANRWCITATDIHSQKLVQEELRRLNRDLEQFAHSVSHDLQEPLRSVLIYGQLLHRRIGAELDSESRSYLDFLLDGAHRMNSLIQGLLAYVQASRSGKPHARSIDAGPSLHKALAGLSRVISESDASIIFGDLPAVSVAPVHLEQLFQNLLGNAIKYARKAVPPVIEIAVAPDPSGWRFSVRDNGIGIEPEYQEQVFGLFKRLHSGAEYNGTGIGLALCARVIELYGGRIWVESEFGSGSTFYFTLPA